VKLFSSKEKIENPLKKQQESNGEKEGLPDLIERINMSNLQKKRNGIF